MSGGDAALADVSMILREADEAGIVFPQGMPVEAFRAVLRENERLIAELLQADLDRDVARTELADAVELLHDLGEAVAEKAGGSKRLRELAKAAHELWSRHHTGGDD